MLSIKQILEYLVEKEVSHQFIGNNQALIKEFSSLYMIKEDSITWARKVENIDINQIQKYKNVLVVLPENTELFNLNKLIVKDPHKVFFQILNEFFELKVIHSIHNRAVIDSLRLGANLNVGANSYISKDAIIGNNVFISNNVSIEGKVIIGDNTVIEAGVVVGVCGYGHFKDDNNNSLRVPHLGGVIIGSNVAIGANTTIARGCLGDTIIEDYVKIDNLCHIAHNVHIKTRSMITACTEISGSTTIEEDVWIGPASAFNNGIVVGKNSFVGIGTIATKDVPEGKVVVGVPARVIRDNE